MAFGRKHVRVPGCLALAFLVCFACGNGSGSGNNGNTDSEMDASGCDQGEYRCVGNVAKACDGRGGFVSDFDCTATGDICVEPMGCATCAPGEESCKDGVATACVDNGRLLVQFDCDTVQGMKCAPEGCLGECAQAGKAMGYYGCEFYPTVTLNPVWQGFDFSVAVANTSDNEAHVTVTRGKATAAKATVPPKSLKVIQLDWVVELKGGDVNACQMPPDPGATRIVRNGAYRLRSDVPVTVYQFNPLSYKLDPVPSGCPLGKDCPGGNGDQCLSYSNDASLLFPATGLTQDYRVFSWPSTKGRASFAAITAIADKTEVTIVAKEAIDPGAGIAAQGESKVTLNAGDVLEVVAAHDVAPGEFGADLSGMLVHSSRPVQVIAGHSCANVPEPKTGQCDHIEESILPMDTWGKQYFIAFPAALLSTSPHVVRIAALEKETTIEFEPSDVHEKMVLGPDDPPLDLVSIARDFKVAGDKPLFVTHFMQGQESVESNSGDPSMSAAVALEQFRADYIFAAPSSFDFGFVNIVAPSGAQVTVDGIAVPSSEFEAIGASGYSAARHELDLSSDFHTLSATEPVGITVYGYGQYTSYMYPGGLNLSRIANPPVI